jgi:uridine phosphorylase
MIPMENRSIAKSELVLTDEGRIYHLHLKPEDIADVIFLVGDPGRVKMMSSLFDRVELEISNREFLTHTGTFKGNRVSVISTGIGTDNIDIVINELDALANIDFDSRRVKNDIRKLKFIRIGTSGALHEDIKPGSTIVSTVAAGLDNLLYFYSGMNDVCDSNLMEAFSKHMDWNPRNSIPYFVHASEDLLNRILNPEYFTGITLSAPGFYAPQGRTLRMNIHDPNYVDKISAFRNGPYRINNFEMEGSALFGLARLLEHDAITVCIALANRITGKFITDYQPYMKKLLHDLLIRITDHA